MSTERTLFALAAVLVGATFLARRAGAAERADELVDDADFLAEINVTAKRIGEGGLLDGLFQAVKDALVPLGIRNNNPMNIRETDINWQGELPHDGDGYENFITATAGIRAGGMVLINYWRIHRLNTVSGIITRWAPKADNNPTQAYIDDVARRLDVEPGDSLNMDNVDQVTDLAMAIIQFENGQNPYTRAFVRDAIGRAFR